MSDLTKHITELGSVKQSDGSYLSANYNTWYNDAGYIHREDGPAGIRLSDSKYFWCLNGKPLEDFEEWCAHVRIPDEQLMMVRLQYG